MSTKWRVVLGFILMVTATAVVAPFFINPENYKSQILKQIEKALGRPVRIEGAIKLRLLPLPKLKIHDLVIQNIQGAKDQEMARLHTVSVEVSLWPLLKGVVQMHKVRLEQGSVSLERLPDGQASWDFKPSSKLEPRTNSSFSLDIDKIELNDLTVTYRTAEQAQVFQKIHLEVDLKDIKGPYELDGHVEWQKIPLKVKGVLGPWGQKLPVDLELESHGQELDLKGQVMLATSAFQGSVKVKGNGGDLPKLSPKLMLPDPLQQPFKLKSDVSLAGDKVTFLNLDLALGAVGAAGRVIYNLATQEVNADLTLVPGAVRLRLQIGLPQTQQGPLQGSIVFQAQDFTQILKALQMPLGKLSPDFPRAISGQMTVQQSSASLGFSNVILNVGKARLEGGLSLSRLEEKGMRYKVDLQTPDIALWQPILGDYVPVKSGPCALKGTLEGALPKFEVDLQATAAHASIGAKGAVSLKGDVLGCQLAVSATGAHLAHTFESLGEATRYPLGGFKARLSLQGDTNHMACKDIDMTLHVGKAPATIQGQLEYFKNPIRPKLTGRLNLAHLDLESLLGDETKASPKTGQGGADGVVAVSKRDLSAQPQTRWSHRPINLAVLKAVDAELKVHVQNISHGALKVHDADNTTNLTNGTLESTLQGKAWDGDLSLKMRLSSQSEQPLLLKVDLKQADLKNMRPGEGDIKLTGGLVSVHCDLSSTGSSQFQYVKNLSGTLTIHGKDGVVQGFDLQKVSQKIEQTKNPKDFLSLLSFSFKGGETRFSTLEGDVVVERGVGKIRKLKIIAPEAVADVTGKVNLPNYNLNVEGVVRFVKSPKFPPFSVRLYGPLDNPRRDFMTDELQKYMLQNVFGKVIENIFINKAKPKDLLKGLLDGGEGVAPAQQAQEPGAGLDALPQEGAGIPQAPAGEPQQPAEKPQDVIKHPEKALKSLLKGLL